MSSTRLRKPHVRKLGGLVTALIASGTLLGATALAFAPLASAATPAPGSFAGSSQGQSFYLAIAGQQLAAGESLAKVDSTPSASAEGTGAILATQKFGDQTASVPGPADGSQVLADSCATPVLPAPLNIIQLNLACGGASASVVKGLPAAASDGYVSDNSTINLDTLLANIPGVGPAVGSTLTQLGTALAPVLNALPGGLGNTVKTLLNNLPITTTVGLDIGKSTSSEVTTATTLTSTATTTGVEIRILPIAGTTLATITVAPATATASVDRATGKATGSTTAAIVTISIPTLGINQTISTPSAPPINIPGLLSVSLENSSVTTNSDNSVTATAGAVDVELLPGVAGGIPGTTPGGISNTSALLSLKLAEVTATAGAAAPATPTIKPGGSGTNTPPALNTTPAASTLPFTGEQPWIPLAGAGLLGMSALALAVRRFGVKPWRS